MKRIIRTTALCALLVAAAELAQAQVKIGDNPTVINKASILELESSTKGLLFPRVSLTNTTTWSLTSGSTPVAGMMVYNIKTVASGFSGTTAYPAIAGDGTGIYYWDGNGWVAAKGLNGADGKSVTGAAGAPGATTPGNEGDTYINTTTGDTYIKQGNTWVLNGNIKGAKGDPGVVGVQGMPGTSGTPGTPGSGTPGAPGAGVTIVTNDSGTWVYNPTTNTWTNINGPKGDKGDKGDPGVVGVQGMPGTSGTPGTPGSGTPGAPGAGVTIVTNDSGTWVYNPTTNTWTNINGPKGDKGDPGVVGVQGLPGTSGTPGTPGSGTPGAPGAGVTIVTNDSGTWVYNPTTNTWTNINGPKGDTGTFTATVDNGLNFSTPTNIQLGGTLIKPTTITTDATQTLAIAGLQNGASADKLVVADANGVLKSVDQSILTVEPWQVQNTTDKATLNAQDIYQIGTVAVGKNNVYAGSNSVKTTFDVGGSMRLGTGHTGDVGVNSLAIGSGNEASALRSISMGVNNKNSARSGAIFGGTNNTLSYPINANANSVIVGGSGNTNIGYATTIVGGLGNQILGENQSHSAIIGGWNNLINVTDAATQVATTSIIVGGYNNKMTPASGTSASSSIVAGGTFNEVRDSWTSIFGAQYSTTLNTNTTILGGQYLRAGATYETVMGTYNALTTKVGSILSWDGTEPLLQLGNGRTEASRNNALTVLKNGKTAIGVIGVDAAAKPTELLDLGGTATATNGGLRIRNINSAAYTSAVATDKIVVADANGVLKTKDVATLVPTITTNNGITKNTTTSAIELGGTLNRATTITTDATQTLAIEGLQAGAVNDKIVVSDPITGVLRSVSPSVFTADLRVVGTDNHVTQDAGVGGDGTSLGTGTGNLAIGKGTLANISSGNRNIGIGRGVMRNLTSGTENIALGNGSLFDLNAGNQNIVIGSNSGGMLTNESNNIIIGNSISGAPSGAVLSNLVNINNNIYSTGAIGNGFGRTALGAFFYNSTTDNVFKETLNIGSGGIWIKDIGTPAYTSAVATDKIVVADANGVLKTKDAAALNATNWQTTGNAGTTATNFLGTTDNVPLNFKIDNTVAGNVSKTGTSFGYKANTGTGDHNTAFGLEALSLVTTGLNNTAMGAQALRVNTGSANTAFGNEALVSNTTGGANVAVGNYAMRVNTTGTGNAVLGNNAMSQNTQGGSNTAVGPNALLRNTTGSSNTAVGEGSLQTNTTGYRNVAIGGSADVSADNLTNAIAIGFNSKVGASNSMALGGTDFYQVNVGINTPTPSNKLHIVGNGTADPVRIEGLQAGAATDKIVVADATGILKTVPMLSPNNIYNANGTLTAKRTVTMGDKQLAFVGDHQETTMSVYSGLLQEGRASSPYGQGSIAIYGADKNGNGSRTAMSLQAFADGDAQILAYEEASSLHVGTHGTKVAAPLVFTTSAGSDALGTEKMRITGTGNVGIAANAPTEKLDVGQGNVRIRDINSNTGAASDKVVVADATGVLKTVAAVAPQFFYTPSLVLPTSNSNLPSYVTYAGGTFTVNLHGVYASQFGMAGNVSGAARTAIKSPTATTLPVLGAAALEYFVTYFDNTVFDPASITLSDAGVLTYQVLSTGTVSEKTYMNIVFKVK